MTNRVRSSNPKHYDCGGQMPEADQSYPNRSTMSRRQLLASAAAILVVPIAALVEPIPLPAITCQPCPIRGLPFANIKSGAPKSER